jgi:protein-S-isoprenylcysteine O-methyltransferase Ste14
VAAGFVILGSALSVWAMASNRFFSGTVRIQRDRGHTVVDGGPYGLVRHPGYLAWCISAPAIPLMLGSLWALIPALLGLCALVLRTSLEDKTLREELPGYEGYAQRVRYRLLPGVW